MAVEELREEGRTSFMELNKKEPLIGIEKIIQGIRCCTDDAGETGSCADCPYSGNGFCITLLLKDTLQWINNHLEPWISVELRSPDYDDTVILYHEGGVIETGYAYNVCGEKHYLHECQYGRVTHWMPLPVDPRQIGKI